MSYRADLDALTARHAALESEVAQKTKELDAATRLLADAKSRARLPVLDNIRIASPCTADWANMTGDERTRFCGACQQNVYNLSDMTRDEAEALLLEKVGRLCVRYYRRADGTILLADCTVGVRKQRKRRVIVAGAAALLAGGAAIAFARLRERGHAEHEHELGKLVKPEMGGVSAPVDPPTPEPSQNSK